MNTNVQLKTVIFISFKALLSDCCTCVSIPKTKQIKDKTKQSKNKQKKTQNKKNQTNTRTPIPPINNQKRQKAKNKNKNQYNLKTKRK